MERWQSYLLGTLLCWQAWAGHPTTPAIVTGRSAATTKEYCLIQQTSITAASAAQHEDLIKLAALEERSERNKVEAGASVASIAHFKDAVSESSNDQSAGRLSEAAQSSEAIQQGWKSPEWFGGFHEGESTWDQDAVEEENAPSNDVYAPDRGGDPWVADALENHYIQPHWFEESRSGGPKQAWQTDWPPVEQVLDNKLIPSLPWRQSRSGRWRQSFEPSGVAGAINRKLSKPAGWFDTHVDQFDAYGRIREPSTHSGRRYLDWTLRTRNASFTCGPPGCTANTSLVIFDPKKEMARHCRLQVGVHATDFDDEYSREFVEYIEVNGEKVNTFCDPMAKQCNTSIPRLERPLYPCVTNYDLHQILHESHKGMMNLTGKISPMVDECPVDGKYLLSGIAVVTCFVRPLPAKPTTTVQPATAPRVLGENATVRLLCVEPGCIANATASLHPELIRGKTCFMNVTIKQTDFDNDHGSVEEVEWVKIGQGTPRTIAKNVKPGRNPCKERALGKNTSDMTPTYRLVKNLNVTNEAQTGGAIPISLKISKMVDECGSHGFLVDGVAQITCA